MIPFDRISAAMMRGMRIATGLGFVALGVGLVALALPALDGPLAAAGPLAWLPAATALHGIFLVIAGGMLLELVTRPPLRLAINVPFVASSFQAALTVGLAVMALLAWGGTSVPLGLALAGGAGFGANLLFVVMTKLHWNSEENRAAATAPATEVGA